LGSNLACNWTKIEKWENTLPIPEVAASTAPRGSPARIPVRIDTETRLKKGWNLSLAVKRRMQIRAKRKIRTGFMQLKISSEHIKL